MFLQLAENRTSTQSSGNANPYIFIPDISGQSKGLFVREDYFDSLPNSEFNQMMRKLAPFQPDVNSGELSEDGFLSGRAERKAEREKKKTAKEREKDAKKTEQDRKKTANKDRRAETIKNLVSTVGGVASSIFGKTVPGGGGDTSTTPEPETTEPKSWYQNPIIWIAGIGLIGGGIYLATRKKAPVDQ